MTNLTSVSFAKRALSFINFIAVLFFSSIYLFGTKYIVEQGLSHTLLEKISVIPSSPTRIFWFSNLSFGFLLLTMYVRDRKFEKGDIARDWFAMLEVLCLIITFIALQFSYNGLILLVFMDIFFTYTDFYKFKEKKSWLLFIVASFGILLLSNYDVLSLLVRTPSLDVYIDFFPTRVKFAVLFLKNFLTSLNIIVFIVSLVTYIIYSVTENHKIEEELLMASQANTRLKEYVAVSEKITEDRERKRISREIHDTIGHALTGISAGIDAVRVLIDLNPEHAKKQLDNVSNVVREGIVDVRRSLNKMRPGALEDHTLKDALEKMLSEYQELSHLQITLDYQWDDVDFDKTKEDIIFRVIQESVTNSLRHGQASQVTITMLNQGDYVLIIQDNGVGSSDIQYGFGLTQMTERLAIIGGRVAFSGEDGFSTLVHIPKAKGEEA
ncbi:sensor histidine kinase [Streptococcus henryi]|uniref:sensor histidine kinase n=1 Tax=Streptococcus henryi TaxID=439219 RepID=UPI00035DC0A9|nr:sensor histidine kinase [Streptococcus henryi]